MPLLEEDIRNLVTAMRATGTSWAETTARALEALFRNPDFCLPFTTPALALTVMNGWSSCWRQPRTEVLAVATLPACPVNVTNLTCALGKELHWAMVYCWCRRWGS